MKTIQQEGRQISGVFLSPDWIENPALAKPWIRQIAQMGYSSMTIFVRHQKRTVLDQSVHDAVKFMVKAGHRLGLKMLLDTDYCWWGSIVVEKHPEAALWIISSMETTVHRGEFEFKVFLPGMEGQRLFEEIAAVFAPDKDGYRPFPVSAVRNVPMHFRSPRPGILMKGTVAGGYSGRLVFYIAMKCFGLVDVAHPLYFKAQEQLLDAYADIPLDGFNWDEPGKGVGHVDCFKAGASFLRLFKKMNGYELRPHLIFLDHLDGTPKAIKVRCDYYRTLVEMNYVAQDRHNRYARKRFGRNLMFGSHQTWSGFPSDLPTGVIDYFRLGKVLTEAWTDGGWDNTEMKYSVHNFMLAEGLKKELGKRNAYYNEWGATVPGVGNMQCANRLKMLFHVNWFGCVSNFHENLLNLTQEPIKTALRTDTQNLDRFDALVTDEFAPRTEVAYLYSWETLAACPKWLVRLFYTNFVNLSLHLTDKALYAAIMSGYGLCQARISKGFFSIHGLRYRVLIVPYATVLGKAVYRKVMEISEAGIPVVVVGPPMEYLAEEGQSVSDDFAGRVGIKPVSFKAYAGILGEQSGLPGVNEWEPSWVDMHYPLTATTGELFRDIEGHTKYVKSSRQALYYMPAPDPREDLVNLVAALVKPAIEAYGEGIYYRVYSERRNPDSDRKVLVAVAHAHAPSYGLTPDKYGSAVRPPIKEREMKALFRTKGGELILKGGTWCAVKIEGTRIVKTLGDCPHIQWNGKLLR